MRRAFDIPLLVVLVGLTGLAMALPAAHAFVTGDLRLAVSFAWHALLTTGMAVLLGVATTGYRPANLVRSRVLSLLGAYVVLPVLAAFPLVTAVPGLRILDGWFEMVSAFTTTGASLHDAPQVMPLTVHLWRALVGWGGGLFVMIAAVALLAPMNLGGFEVLAGRAGAMVTGDRAGPTGLQDPAAGAPSEGLRRDGRMRGDRLLAVTQAIAPVYAGLTGLLWLALLIAGQPPVVAFCHALSTLATSGISPVGGIGGSGMLAESLVFVFLVFALTRQAMPASPLIQQSAPGRMRAIREDPELRFALRIVVVVAAVLVLRHAFGAWQANAPLPDGLATLLRTTWGALFTTASFLSTTGFVSGDWGAGAEWSGLGTPGLVLAAVAVMGGGIATTAGGIKLLRLIALGRQSQRELERLLYPSSIGGSGPQARRLRGPGAYAAWLFVMLWVLSAALVLLALALTGQRFEPALIFTLSALSTTGPLAAVASETPLSWALLSDAGRIIAGLAMILGRLETLALVALISPDFWRN